MAGAVPVGYRPPEMPAASAPAQQTRQDASTYLRSHDDAVPLGANDIGCVPGVRHPRPVVLAHGTDSSAYADWAAIAPDLAADGFCVFALNYGGRPGAERFGTEDVVLSAYQVGEFVDQVLAWTGAQKVDLVGFSQGATVTRYYVNKLGGAGNVDLWVGLASPSYGGDMYGLVPIAESIPGALQAFAAVTSVAVVQQAQGSPVITDLNAGGDTVPGVRYVTVGSRVDEMIQPFGNIALRGEGARNIAVQDRCPEDLTGHFQMVYDPYVRGLLRHLLDPTIPEPACHTVDLGTGIPEVIIGAHS
ncbi:alpha/beta fold hydrolase [Nocardia callitridis]|uniref:Alpha/beta fold hydrolase n=1 Tax=Nocardia callitridis TaxID=648753 RepID=A0ABP9KBD3_9NOCA